MQLLKDHPATMRDEDLPNEQQVLLLLKEHSPFSGEIETLPVIEKLKPVEDHPVMRTTENKTTAEVEKLISVEDHPASTRTAVLKT